MSRRACDGTGLVAALGSAVANLEAHVDEVNALNVFPVPDGDTGSNMLATVRVALAAAQAVADRPVGEIAAAVTRGALHGARGNSGVIASQILGGMATGLEGKKRITGPALAFALQHGVERSYRAVKEPVEGTMLTVIRDAAEAAKLAAEKDRDIDTVLAAAVDAAEQSVARTPSLLPILREAGVVDAGGRGLFLLLQGALMHLVGTVPAVGRTLDAPRLSLVVAGADEGHGYETVFFLRSNGSGPIDLDAIRERLALIGESVIVAGDAAEAKIHVHNDRPDEIIAYGLSVGVLTDITVTNLDQQTAEVRDRRVAELVGDGSGRERMTGRTVLADEDDVTARALATLPAPRSGGAAAARTMPTPASIWVDPRARNGATMPLAIVAVASGEGLEKEFRDRGASAIVRGGQTVNPSAGELLAAIDRLNAAEVVILPNNRNVIMAATQVVGLATRPVHVVPTRNAVEGLEAILAVNPSLSPAENVVRMCEQSRSVQTFQVTDAVRDARVGGRRVKRGHAMVLDPDEGLVASDRDRSRAVLAALRTLTPGFELVNLLYGDGADLAEAESISRAISTTFPAVEVDVARGGQPLYPYLVAVW